MSRFRQRKAFTIVEMVIVIAVIAILATVLVPTISGVIQKANHSTDVQFAASLNVQLAMYAVDKPIRNESDLRDAINYYYGEWELDENGNKKTLTKDFYAELAPKSAKQGYHYWYAYEKGVVFVETAEKAGDKLAEIGGGSANIEELFGSNKLSINMKPGLLFFGSKNAPEGNIMPLANNDDFSPASLRSDIIPGAYLMGQSDDEETLTGIITKLENLSGPQDYTNIVKKALALVGEKPEEEVVVEAFKAKLKATTIVTDGGAYRFNAVDNIDYVYVPLVTKSINIQKIYQFDPDTGDADDGTAPSESCKLANPAKVSKVQIPVGVKIASNGFPAMSPLAKEDLSNLETCKNATVLEFLTSNMADLNYVDEEGVLRFAFDLHTDYPVFKLQGSTQLYVIVDDKPYPLPYIEGVTAPVEGTGTGGTGTSQNLNVEVTFPTTTLGENVYYYDTVNKILYVQFNQTEVPIDVKNGQHVTWTYTEVKAEGEEPASEMVAIDNSKVKITDGVAGKQIRVTGKINGEVKASFIVCLVGPNNVEFGSYNGNIDAIDGLNPTPIDLKYEGTATFTFDVDVKYTTDGMVAPWDVTFKSENGNFTVTKNYVKDENNNDVWDKTVTITLTGTYDFEDVLTITIGNGVKEVKFNVKCVDASGFAFEKAPVKDGSTQKVSEDYMFRVGTSGTEITLNRLFATSKAVPNVAIEIYDISEDASGKTLVGNGGIGVTVTGADDETKTMDAVNKDFYKSRRWEMTRDTWGDVSLKFSGTGIVKVVIGKMDGDSFTEQESVYLEVVNGKNVFSYSELGTSGNQVLWNDIALTGDKHSLSDGTLFGNGYIFDVTGGGIGGTGYRTENYLVKLNNANLDNIQIVGPVYNSFSLTAGNDYNRANVIASGTCAIYNSYISNAASPIRLVSGELTVVGTTLKGGSFANIDHRNGALILDDVITINQVNSNDPYLGDGTYKNKPIVGLGIVIWYETTNGSESITVRDVNNNGTKSLTQYNYIANNQTGNCISTASSLVDVAFEQAGAKFVYTDGNGVKWLNTGILSMATNVSPDNISDITGYDWGTVTYASQTGNLQTEAVATVPSNISKVAPTYVPTAQGFMAPTISWDYPSRSDNDAYTDTYYCYYDEELGKVKISFEQNSSFVFDPGILTATKLGESLVVKVYKDGVLCSGDITFEEVGSHTLTFTYEDTNNYRLKDGDVESYSIIHTKTLNVEVSVAQTEKDLAEFTFGSGTAAVAGAPVKVGDTWYVSASGYTGESGTKNGITYIIVDVNYTEDTTGSGTLKTSTSTLTHKTTFGGDTCQMTILAPIFDRVVSITDNELGTFGSGTTTMPTDNRLTVYDDNGLMSWSSGVAASTTPFEKNGNIYLKPTSASGNNRTRNTYVVEFTYQSIHGELYHYYVGYRTPEVSKSGSVCVTPDTLVTLADGSQKRVDEVTYDDKLLAWNMFTGRYEETYASYIISHGDDTYRVIDLEFSDGTHVRIQGEHGFLDANSGKWVFINEQNAASYLGQEFVKQNGESYSNVELVDYSVYDEYTGSYSIASAACLNVITNGVLSVTPVYGFEDSERFYNFLEMGENLQYDAEALQADIEMYGLFEYEDLAEYMTIEEFNFFKDCNGCYWKIAVEKGVISLEELLTALWSPDLV